MTEKRLRIFWWALTTAYISTTYAMLGIMPSMWTWFNSYFGGNGVMVQYAVYALVCMSVLYHMFFLKKERHAIKYVLFFLFLLIFFVMIKFEKNPGEKIHMAQYGLFGILLYNFLKADFNRYDNKLYIVGAAICMVAGAIDEVIQGALPNRYFTWHDVFINGISGIIALLIIRFNILDREL